MPRRVDGIQWRRVLIFWGWLGRTPGSADAAGSREIEPLSQRSCFAHGPARPNALDRLARRIFRALDVVMALQVQPTLRVGAEKRASRNAVSALMPRRSRKISLMRAGVTCSA